MGLPNWFIFGRRVWALACLVLYMPYRNITRCSFPATEPAICRRYSARLEAIAALDREYYLNAYPSLAERAEYCRRQDELDCIRRRLYSELGEARRTH